MEPTSVKNRCKNRSHLEIEGQKAENGNLNAENEGRNLNNVHWKPENGHWKPENGHQKLENGPRKPVSGEIALSIPSFVPRFAGYPGPPLAPIYPLRA